MVEDETRAKKLKYFEIPKSLGPIGSSIYLVKSRGKTLSKPARVFEEFIKLNLPRLLTEKIKE